LLVELSYGKGKLKVGLPGKDITVVEPVFIPGLADETGAIREAVESPVGSPSLYELAKGKRTVAINFCDATRPVPNKKILPVVLGELKRAGVKDEDIVLVNALGTHRPGSKEEIVELLGEEIASKYRVVQHDCNDRSTMADAGVLSDGQHMWVNRDYYEADLKILTGFIEPHFFAGFSGGGKLVYPGVASLENIKVAHGYRILSDKRSTWGITDGNPVWELLTEGALKTGPDFIVNVTLNKDKAITGVFAGELRAAHAKGCAYVKRTAMRAVKEPFDIVVTTNSGYPLDRNVYQTVKGMSAAAGIVKEGGAIISVSQCVDGIPAGSHYHKLMLAAGDPRRALEMIAETGFSMQDQWQVQLQAELQVKADVYLYSQCLTDEDIRSSMFKPCRSIEGTVAELLGRYGADAKICVLPEGPQTIPYIEG